jgi:hypothetical protein
MLRTYDLFEVMPAGDLIWRAKIEGHESAIDHLQQAAKLTPIRNVRLADHGGTQFLTSSLGPNWQEVVRSWPEAARLDLLVELRATRGWRTQSKPSRFPIPVRRFDGMWLICLAGSDSRKKWKRS